MVNQGKGISPVLFPASSRCSCEVQPICSGLDPFWFPRTEHNLSWDMLWSHMPMIKPRDPQNQVSISTAGSPPSFLLWFWLGFLNVGQDDSPKGEVPWIIPENDGRGAFMAPHGFYWEKLFTTHRSLLIWLETHAKWSFGDQDSNLAGPYLLSIQPIYNPL